MDIPWHQFTESDKSLPITQTGLTEKASVIGRTGLMMLSCGTGAWRVRSSMNSLATLLGVTCTTDIGLMSIEYTCFDGTDCYSQSLCLTNTGVNTSKLNRLERFVNDFDHECCTMSGEQIHTYLDQIEQIHGLYSPFALGCASALACSAFTFLLGGGPIEMLCAFFGAGIGNYLRCKLTKHHFTLFLCIAASVSSACLVYAWMVALLLHLQPVDFLPLNLTLTEKIIFRLLASFCGVFGFSIMFNSPRQLAAAAAAIGAIANTFRLELVDLLGTPSAAAAFLGALTAGLLASLLKNHVGYPRIAITVPSIVIMVPGLYLYRAIYNLGIMSLDASASWFASAILIIVCLPLGLIFARILTDKMFRYCT